MSTVLATRPHDPAEWVIAKRRGNRVRYRSTVTGAWSGWEKLSPSDPNYITPGVPVAKEHVAIDAPMPIEQPEPPKPSVADAEFDRAMLDAYTTKELNALAKSRNLTGYSKMRKADLVDFLIANQDAKGVHIA